MGRATGKHSSVLFSYAFNLSKISLVKRIRPSSGRWCSAFIKDAQTRDSGQRSFWHVSRNVLWRGCVLRIFVGSWGCQWRRQFRGGCRYQKEWITSLLNIKASTSNVCISSDESYHPLRAVRLLGFHTCLWDGGTRKTSPLQALVNDHVASHNEKRVWKWQ